MKKAGKVPSFAYTLTMVVTRSVKTKPSISADAPKAKKIKFLDDSFNDTEFLTADEVDEKIEDDQDEGADLDLDLDSDEAPEEESTSHAKDLIIKRQKEQKELELIQKREEKERRRKQDLLHSEQQKLKKQEQASKAEDVALPDFLPEDIFDSIDQEEEEQDDEDIEHTSKSKHLKLSDFEDMDKRELARQIKEEKLRQLKLKKKLLIKKGPVHVNVTSAAARQINKKLVPVAESKIVNSRSKWLKRKSLGKK